ncbi:MAG: LysM peptidoglycan-binding domain-containing protein [Chlamydiae bacterium]|nr:LysM peptidoglycan-binding domain-containing protein [Chlamydiota bacterium]
MKYFFLAFLILFQSGCAINDIATKEDVTEVQGHLQARQTDLSEEMVGLKRKTAQLESDLEEISRGSKTLEQKLFSQQEAYASELKSLEQKNATLQQKISELQGNFSKVDTQFQARAKEAQTQRASDLAKMDEKLKIILEEISKENESLHNEIRSMKKTPIPSLQEGDTHTVQPGESLSKIAASYGVSSQALAQANGITNVHSVRVGQKLKIPKR